MLFTEMYCMMKPGDMIVGSHYDLPHIELWFVLGVEKGRDVNGELYVHFWTYPTIHARLTERYITGNSSSFHTYWQESTLVHAGPK